MRRTGITHNGRIGVASMNHKSVIADLGNKWPAEITHNETGQNDEGISLRDEKTPLFEVMNTTLCEIDAIFNLHKTRGFQIRLLGLGGEGLEFLFLNGKKWIDPLRLLRPTVTRLGKKKRG